MLKLTMAPGEFLQIGENVRVIFTRAQNGYIHLMVDAPREINIARSTAMEKHGTLPKGVKAKYRQDEKLSEDALRKIRKIISEDKEKAEGERLKAEARKKDSTGTE
jgi:carbon storage regulator